MENNSSFRLTDMFRHFFRSEKTGGILLILCTILSMVLANSSLSEGYLHFWHATLNLSVGSVSLHYSVEEWINDGLMAIFFLMVGLEIERELYIGELADFKDALLPIVAAIGGMAAPALIHFWLNRGTPSQAGIGIPMATDIAFSLGVLSLLGSRIPPALKIFLTALAIIDDLGAVIIIAIFYTGNFSMGNLGIALGIFCCLLLLNRMKVYNLWVYLVPGAVMWYFMLKSGVHATISGVLLAFAVPFTKGDRSNPSHTLQHALHNSVNFLILPIFALANTGIRLHPSWSTDLFQSNSVGILTGLVLGKPLGIIFCCWVAVKGKFCSLPEGIDWRTLSGAGILAGIGFTMSIFISNLAFATDVPRVEESKIAILIASGMASLAGLFLLWWSGRKSSIPPLL